MLSRFLLRPHGAHSFHEKPIARRLDKERQVLIMPSNRMGRINEEVQRELSSLLRSVKDPRVNQGMLSVTRVEVSSDLGSAKVFISVLGDVDEKDLMRGLRSASGFMRRELGNRLQLRHTPELTFIRDASIEHGAHIARILNELDIKPDSEENDEETDD